MDIPLSQSVLPSLLWEGTMLGHCHIQHLIDAAQTCYVLDVIPMTLSLRDQMTCSRHTA